MFAGITANQHHDTAGVQHFFENHLFPWFWENTIGLKDSGALFYIRSDGCRAQFKSGRHFRWLSRFPEYEWAGGVRPIHSHFESCHGKDMSDPECGRYKYLMAMAELRGEIIKTAEEAKRFLDRHSHTTKSFQQKHARGILVRTFFYTEAKSIRPLSSFAEVDSLKNSAGV